MRFAVFVLIFGFIFVIPQSIIAGDCVGLSCEGTYGGGSVPPENCGVSSNCNGPNQIIRCDSPTCTGSCVCYDQSTLIPTPGAGGGDCPPMSNCGPLVCPAGKSGYNYCNSGRCEAFCGAVEPPGPGNPAPAIPTATPTIPGATSTPTPTNPPVNQGNIFTKAVIIQSVADTCDQVRTAGESIGNSMFGAYHTLQNALVPYNQTYQQLNTYYVGFRNLTANYTYSLMIDDAADGYVPVKSCMKITNNGSTTYDNNATFSYALNSQDEVRWDIGYVWGSPWFQARGGHVQSPFCHCEEREAGATKQSFKVL